MGTPLKYTSEASNDDTAPTPTNDYDPPVDLVP